MPMPTTRYGRYIFYRNRARRRKRREETRRPSTSIDGKQRTGRHRLWDLWGKQAPKEYPRYVHPHDAYDWHSTASWITNPKKGVFPVIRDIYRMPPFTWPIGHPRTSTVGFQWRRVQSMPRARHRPWAPWRFTREELLPGDFYSLEFYPSGARSYYYRTFVDP
jgi:hypothetical protein